MQIRAASRNMAFNPLVNTREKCLRYFERDNFDVYSKTAMDNP